MTTVFIDEEVKNDATRMKSWKPENVVSEKLRPQHRNPFGKSSGDPPAYECAARETRVEDYDFGDSNIVKVEKMDGLALAMHTAYAHHYPFEWSPDALWLRIAQSLATHIHLNSDKLRSKLVNFQGKKRLWYCNDDFVMGQHNPWELFFDSMATQIGKNVQTDLQTLFTEPFSTTQPIHTASANGMLMYSVQNYFEYYMLTMCGVPEIYFTGTTQDWENVYSRAERGVKEFLPEWWQHLSPILTQFIRASKGDFDKEFWRNMYKLNDSSGGPYISGWVTTLYPYIVDDNGIDVRNPYAFGRKTSKMNGLLTNDFPSGLSRVPYTWNYLGKEYNMSLLVGAFGVHQNPKTLALMPAYGWVVEFV